MGNGKGAPAGMTSMDEILSFQQQVKYLLYKISRNGAHPVPLDAVSDYKEAEAVPPEKRARLLRDLRGEVQAREIMGDEAYFGTASLISKIITYEQAMDEISNRKMIEGTRDMRVTWAEFRRMIAAEIFPAVQSSISWLVLISRTENRALIRSASCWYQYAMSTGLPFAASIRSSRASSFLS